MLLYKAIEIRLVQSQTRKHVIGQPKRVGRLTLRGKIAEYLGSVPFDALTFISQLLKAGDVRFLILRGERPNRGSAAIRSMTFEKDFVREDCS